MRRGRVPSTGLSAELFPFLAVLACIIGTLTLLVIVVTTGVLGEKRSVKLVARDASGRSASLKPHILECRFDGVRIYTTGEFVANTRLNRPDTPLRRFLADVASRKNAEYVIVAVRPDGYTVFEAVRRQIESSGIQIGYEPVDAEWTLRGHP